MQKTTRLLGQAAVIALLILVLNAQFSGAASVFGGPGIVEGLHQAATLFSGGGIATAANLPELILRIITFILDFLLLIAVLVLVIAGVMLIVSGGEEGTKDRAKRMVIYLFIGILLILFARLLIIFITRIFG